MAGLFQQGCGWSRSTKTRRRNAERGQPVAWEWWCGVLLRRPTHFSSLPGSYKHLGIDTALEGVYLGGNKQHKAALIATLQETLLQRETHAFPMKKKKSFFFSLPSLYVLRQATARGPQDLLLSVKSRLVPGKRSFQVSPEMKGRGNVCGNAGRRGRGGEREKREEGKGMREEEEKDRRREGEAERARAG